jgi:hypothetical protein
MERFLRVQKTNQEDGSERKKTYNTRRGQKAIKAREDE